MSYRALDGKTYDNRFEAVVVCLNYADFLAQTLPMNVAQVDRLVVVTGYDDNATRAICSKWSVECVLTDAFTERGEVFNKGAAINIGLGALRQQGWIFLMDADIVLPQTFRNMLDKSALDPECLYGAERANVSGWKKWSQLKSRWHEEPQFSCRCFVSTPPEFPLVPNVVHKHHGYTPPGFFQLWHSSYMHRYELRYPDTESTAEQSDVQWALRWPRRNRIMLPTVRLYHLESETGPMGANWHGRRTKPFTPDGFPLPQTESKGYSYWMPR